MSDHKPIPRRGPAPPQARYQPKLKPLDEDYATKSTLVDYEWHPQAAAASEAEAAVLADDDAAAVIVPLDEDLPEVDVEMEPLD